MRFFTRLCTLGLLLASLPLAASELKSDEEIIYFPTSAAWNEQENGWRVPLHGWVFEAERDSLWRNGTLALLRERLGLSPRSNDSQHLKERGWPFVVDNERHRQITLRIAARDITLPPSHANGHFSGETRLSGSPPSAGKPPQWLQFETVMPEGDTRHFSAEVQLIAEEGLSVISDIDDTIKISNVLDREALLQNTFLRDFEAVPGMAALFAHWQEQGAAFHYITGSPWQLYSSLSEFIATHGFPRGSFNMRQFRIKDASLFDFLRSSHDYKVITIEALMRRYPRRHFILVGDSGEKDPEVYGEIARRHPAQIGAIYIHNVTAELAEAERFAQAFHSLPQGLWMLFDDGLELQRAVAGR